MIDLEGFTKRIESFYNDVRTEVLVAELLHEGLSPDQLTILNAGQHKRSFRRDLDEAFVEVNKNNQSNLVFRLNRDSIYDSLPESLFHHISTQQQGSSVKNMVGSYRKRKEEERQARAFFTPLENEFFLQRAFIELMEQEFLDDLNKNNFEDYFLNFFNVPSGLPRDLVRGFAALLPYRDKIVGDLSLTFKSLEIILGDKVKYNLENAKLSEVKGLPILSKAELGLNFTLGNTFMPEEPSLVVFIGPVKKTDLNQYLQESVRMKFIETYFSFFLPAMIDVSTHVLAQDDSNTFILGSTEENAILGYTTQLTLIDTI